MKITDLILGGTKGERIKKKASDDQKPLRRRKVMGAKKAGDKKKPVREKKVVGGKVNWPIPDGADLLSAKELEGYIQAKGLETSDPFSDLDLSMGSSPDPLAGQWPEVIVKPLAMLLRQFRVSQTGPYRGHHTHTHGTTRFSELRSKGGKWTGTQADLDFHHAQVRSMNLALLLYFQGQLGIERPDLQVRLKFHSALEAQQILEGGSGSDRQWAAGLECPDREHMVIVLQQKLTDDFKYAAFSLIVPAPIPAISWVPMADTISPTTESPAPHPVQPADGPGIAAKINVSPLGSEVPIPMPGVRLEKGAPSLRLAGPSQKRTAYSASPRGRIRVGRTSLRQVVVGTVRAIIPPQRPIPIGSACP